MNTLHNFINLFRRTSFIPLFISFVTVFHAQKDSLILKNKDVIVGEIKSMDKGVLTVETDYTKAILLFIVSG